MHTEAGRNVSGGAPVLLRLSDWSKRFLPRYRTTVIVLSNTVLGTPAPTFESSKLGLDWWMNEYPRLTPSLGEIEHAYMHA